MTIVGNTVKNISGGSETRGINAGYSVKGGVVDGNTVYSNGQQGILVRGSDVIISNNICKNNGQSSGGNTEGIRVWAQAADINRVVLRNNRCFDDQGTPTQTHGIKLEATSGFTLSGTVIEGNHLEDNGTDPFTTGGAGTITGTVIRGNRGYITESSGTSTIPSASTSVTVSHGLNVTPTAKDCAVTATNNLGNASTSAFWADTFGATSFKINVGTDPGASTATFAWTCQVL